MQTKLEYLCTPFPQHKIVNDPERAHFNTIFCACRAAIERSIGVLKMRFPVLEHGLRLPDMTKCSRLVYGLVAIHNFLLEFKDDFVMPTDEYLLDMKDPTVQPPPPPLDEAERNENIIATNERIFQTYFVDQN